MSPFWKTAILAVGVGVGVALWGCPQQTVIPLEETAEEVAAKEQEAILSLAGQYIEAYNAADAEAVADLFTLRAIRMPPGEPGFSGRSRIQQDFERIFDATEGQLTLNVEDTVVNGDLAYARGSYASTARSKGGRGEQHEVGKWVNVLEREPDGPWRISTQIWNVDGS